MENILKLKIGTIGYKDKPTQEELKELKLKNVKFLSTHNTFIRNRQYGGQLSYRTVIEQIKAARYMPVCIELDISVYSKKKQYTNDIFIDHFTSEFDKTLPISEELQSDTQTKPIDEISNPNIIKAKQYESDKDIDNYFKCYNLEYHSELLHYYEIDIVFNNILKLIHMFGGKKDIPYLFPIVLNIDATHSNKSLLNYIIDKYNSIFNAYTANNRVNRDNKIVYNKDNSIDINETTLESLMGKVLLRHEDSKVKQKSHIKKKKSTLIVLKDDYSISSMPDDSLKTVLSRSYPDFSIHGKTSLKNTSKLKALKEAYNIKRGNKRCRYKTKKGEMQIPIQQMKKSGVTSCNIFRKYGECDDYKLLNKLIVEEIYGINNYNMVAFNYTDVDKNVVTTLIEDFTKLYSSYYNITPLIGGHRKKTARKKTARKKTARKKTTRKKTTRKKTYNLN